MELRRHSPYVAPELGRERAAPIRDGSRVNYDQIFDEAIDRLHTEGRYRVFIDILRNKGAFPNARCFAGHNGPKPITVWCSNDYLAMGQHPKVIEAMEEALHDVGAGSGGTRNAWIYNALADEQRMDGACDDSQHGSAFLFSRRSSSDRRCDLVEIARDVPT